MSTVKTFPEFVQEHIENKKLENLKIYLQAMSDAEIIIGLKEVDPSERAVVYRLLPKDKAIEVFELMDVAWQKDIVESLSDRQAVELLGGLDPDDRVQLLDELPAKVAKQLLEQLPEKKKEITAALMGYEDDTVGRIMSPFFVDIKKTMTVSQALERIRQKKNGDDVEITTVYVTDATRKLEGILPLSALVTSDPGATIENVLKDEKPAAVQTSEDQEKAARLLQQLDALELPVLDRENRLVGVLKAEAAMDVIREEVTDDMFDKVGLLDLTTRESDRSSKLLTGSFFHVVGVRVPFLLITLAGGMLAGAVIDAFEEILEAVVATAIFIPVIMDMGGNVGTQSSTIFTRGMVLGQINMRRFFRHWARETLFGFGMAVLLGALGGLVAFMWQGIPGLGLAVGFAMTLTITIGIAMGFLVPYVLIKLGFDQAAGADPIITTIKDMSGLVIYFSSVAFFLPHLVG